MNSFRVYQNSHHVKSVQILNFSGSYLDTFYAVTTEWFLLIVIDQSQNHFMIVTQLFHDGDSYHIEISPLICRTNRWVGFCMIGASAIMELMDCLDTMTLTSVLE